MSDMVCSISIAHAAGMAVARSPPTASHAARHRHGRTRLPPASSEYLVQSGMRGMREAQVPLASHSALQLVASHAIGTQAGCMDAGGS